MTAAGVVALIEPVKTFADFAEILGFVFMLIGVMWVVRAFYERVVNDLWWLTLTSGILMTVMAFWVSGQFFLTARVHAAGVRRHLGPDGWHHGHRAGASDPPPGLRRRTSAAAAHRPDAQGGRFQCLTTRQSSATSAPPWTATPAWITRGRSRSPRRPGGSCCGAPWAARASVVSRIEIAKSVAGVRDVADELRVDLRDRWEDGRTAWHGAPGADRRRQRPRRSDRGRRLRRVADAQGRGQAPGRERRGVRDRLGAARCRRDHQRDQGDHGRHRRLIGCGASRGSGARRSGRPRRRLWIDCRRSPGLRDDRSPGRRRR